MGKKLIFLDIDGTLVVPGMAEPPESALSAIGRARANGHRVFLCTGRNLGMLKPLLRYPFDGAIGSAGGYVFCGDQVLYDHPMSNALRDEVVETLLHAGISYTLETRDAAYSTPQAVTLREAMRSGDSENLRWKRTSPLSALFRTMDEYDGSPVYKIVFICRESDRLDEAERLLGDRFLFCRLNMFEGSGMIHGELINRDFDKGAGIRKICAYWNVPLKDTVGFGDSMNDLSMLETTGVSVCMANGSEELKKISDLVCPSAEQDGLAAAFAQLGLE